MIPQIVLRSIEPVSNQYLPVPNRYTGAHRTSIEPVSNQYDDPYHTSIITLSEQLPNSIKPTIKLKIPNSLKISEYLIISQDISEYIFLIFRMFYKGF